MLSLFHYCTICGRQEALAPLGAHHHWCDRCREDFRDLARHHPSASQSTLSFAGTRFHLYTLFDYKDLFRRFLLRGKVQGDPAVAHVLAALVAEHPIGRAALAWADVLIPAPASFWSRSRGRLDVAAAVSDELSTRFALPCLAAPAHLHWRLKKRARTARRLRVLTPKAVHPWIARWRDVAKKRWSTEFESHAPGPKALIVDDVVTTGFTLATVARALEAPGLQEVRLLALADARAPSAPRAGPAPEPGLSPSDVVW